MTGPVTFSIEGLRETEAALAELPKATAKNAGRRALRAGAQPMLDDFQSRAPRLSGHLVETAGISTKLSRRQKAQHKSQEDRDNVEMFIGAGPNPQAVQQEFGNENHPANPSLIPAFENNKRRSVTIIGDALWKEIRRAAERLARKTARFGGGR